jgi:hypothetical protein
MSDFQDTKFYRKAHEYMIADTVEAFIREGAMDWKLDDDEVMESKTAEIYRFIEYNLKDQCEQATQGLEEDEAKSLLDHFTMLDLIETAKDHNLLHDLSQYDNLQFMTDILGLKLFEEMSIGDMVSEVIDGILYQQEEAQGEESEDEDD